MNVLSLIAKLRRLDIRIELAADKLKLNAPEGALTPGIINEIKEKKTELIEFLQKELQQHVEYTSIQPAEKKKYHVLSSAQKRLYLLHQMVSDNISYNLPYLFFLRGRIDLENLEAAFKGLVVRHESLRTSFEMAAGEYVQKIHNKVEFEIEYYQVDVKAKVKVEKEGESRGQVLDVFAGQYSKSRELRAKSYISSFIRPFDLSCAPLFRVGLIKIEKERHILMVDMHHIISDGTSLNVLFMDFAAFYRGEKLPGLRIQYKDFSEEQKSKRVMESIKGQAKFWQEQFQGEIPRLDLPTDYSRPLFQDFAGDWLEFELDNRDTTALKNHALEEETTLYMVTLAIFALLLSKLSSQEDITLGTPVAGRGHADLEKIVGMFVNTLALRIELNENNTFNEFLHGVNNRVIRAFENQEYPFEDLVESLQLTRDITRNPLFDVMFVMQNVDRPGLKIPGLELTPGEYKTRTSKFDLTLYVLEREDHLLFLFEYSTKLFEKETILRFINYFKIIISLVIENPGIKISQLEIITAEEKQRILSDFNDTFSPYPRDKTLHELFRGQVEKRAGHTAILSRHRHLTYKTLDEKSDQLALLLRKKGAEPGKMSGIMMRRSLDMVIGILAILKSGSAYLPIDPAFPAQRIKYILNDSHIEILLTQKENENKSQWLKGIEFRGEILDLAKIGDEEISGKKRGELLSVNVPGDLVYVMYTSGSTGRPKGVMVEHGGIVNILTNLQELYPLLAADGYLLKTNYTFDVSVTELFSWFFGEGKLLILEPDREKDAEAILEAAAKYRVTHINFVPSLFNVFLDVAVEIGVEKLAGLKYIFVAGEAFPGALVKKWSRLGLGARVENIYGPTEASIYAARYSINPDIDITGTSLKPVIPIGKPMNNTRCFVFDKGERCIQPVSAVGELCIGGPGLARGYLNQPGLTNERFISSPLAGGERIYRSGDMVRWLPDGNILYLGRRDQQVKIRGFRIELSEIQNQLLSYEGVQEAVVILREQTGGEKQIAAYMVPAPGLDTTRETIEGPPQFINDCREFLRERLPEYMIPSAFVLLDELPLTPGGKIDNGSLPEPGMKVDDKYAAPRTGIERKLTEIWSELLSVDKEMIGIDANFFKLGGHSLTAMILVSKIHKTFSIKTNLAEIFKNPTIRSLSLCIRRRKSVGYESIAAAEKRSYYVLSSAQKRLYILQQMDQESTSYNMPALFSLSGEMKREKPGEVFRHLIARHESLRTSFHMVQGEPVQRIHPGVEFAVEYKKVEGEVDPPGKGESRGRISNACGGQSPESRELRAKSFIYSFVRPFNLSRAPLLRAAWFEVEAGKHLLVIDMHHIIIDGFSIQILEEEFLTLNQEAGLPGLRLQYKDYARWQQGDEHQEIIKQQESYWLRLYPGKIPVLNLPLDFPRPARQDFEGSRLRFSLSEAETGGLIKITHQANATLFMTVLSLVYIFLAKITGKEDIIVGTPAAGRSHGDLENIIGMFVNTLALRNFPCGHKSFFQFLLEVRKQTLEAFENQEYPFEDLVDNAAVHRAANRNPLFDVMFLLFENRGETGDAAGSKAQPDLLNYEAGKEGYEFNSAKFDWIIRVDKGGCLRFDFVYAAKLFKEQSIEKYIGYFRELISLVVDDCHRKLSSMEIIPGDEMKEILEKTTVDVEGEGEMPPEEEEGPGAVVLPRDPIEEKLAGIWQRILKRETIGVNETIFDLGGNSLKMLMIVAEINKEFNRDLTILDIYERQTLGKLARLLAAPTRDETGEVIYSGIAPVEKREYYILSSAQKRMFILHRFEGEQTNYNMPMVLELGGEVDRDRLTASFSRLIRRHESLRTSFLAIGEEPVQRISAVVEFKLEYEEIEEWSSGRASGRDGHDFIRCFIKPFALDCAPLLRVGLLKLASARYLLVVDMHHIISDGVSVRVLTEEFLQLYGGACLDSPRIHYKDYALWQQRVLFEESNKHFKEKVEYWLQKFSDAIPVLELPYDYQRPPVQSFEGNRIGFDLEADQAAGLKDLVRDHDVTLFMLLLAIFNILLSKLSGQEDIVVGAPTAGRSHADLEKIIGMFVNTLALRHFPRGNHTFTRFLKQVKERTLKDFANQDYQYEKLVDQVVIERDASRNPLFDVLFALQDIFEIPVNELEQKRQGLTITPYAYEDKTSKFDLAFFAYDRGEKLYITIEYCTRIFREETIRRFANYFKTIISTIVKNSQMKISGMEIISREEKQQVLFEFNNTKTAYSRSKSIIQLFEQQVEKIPQKLAVVFQGESITYKKLNEKSAQLAAYLYRKGFHAEQVVGIMVNYSLEMIIGILAILKAGGVYLPINIDYPQTRKTYMLKESNIRLLMIDDRDKYPGSEVKEIINLNVPGSYVSTNEAKIKITSIPRFNSLAYVMYTSGSTGAPRGVMVEHRSVVRLVNHTNYIEFKPEDRILQTGALEFDASTFEVWGALLNGLTLFLVDKERLVTPLYLKDVLNKYFITTLWMTSPLFNQMQQADIEIFSGLRNLLVGGDLLSPMHINGLRERFPGLNVINGYGPTENTTFSTTFLIDKEYKVNIPIGKPIANSTAYILDKYNHLQPINVAGELYVGGDGAARGYLNRPELTAEKFDRDLWDYQDEKKNYKLQNTNYKQTTNHKLQITNKAAPCGQVENAFGEGEAQELHELTPIGTTSNKKLLRGVQGGGFLEKSPPGRRRQKIYKTGDLARWLANGNIEFLGRRDSQVKIRGYRVELGEIENQLLLHEAVKEVVVIDREDKAGDRYLCAYIAADNEPGFPDLREFLSRKLPNYMIPSYFVKMGKLPLTSRGKIDRRALPLPGIEVGRGYIAPGDKVEKKLAAIWSGVLGVNPEMIGIDTDFFQLGGHSLKATTLTARIHKEFEVRVPLLEIFKTPTIRELSAYIRGALKETYASIPAVEKKEYYPLSSAQKRLYLLQRMDLAGTVYNVPFVVRLGPEADQEKLAGVFRQLIRRHESFRTCFVTINDEPVQRIHDELSYEFYLECDEPEASQSAANPLDSFIRPFDLARIPLLRVGLIKWGDQGSLLVVDMHHIISDGASMKVLAEDFMGLYRGEPLPGTRIQYRDYANWQNSPAIKKKLQSKEDFWLKEFSHEIPVLDLPYDCQRPAVQDFVGRTVGFEISESQAERIKALARQQGVTSFMMWFAIFNILLSKLSGQEDIVVGTPGAGRRHADLERIIGMFVNTLALRNYPLGSRTFIQWLQEIKNRTLKAFENQEYQFEDLVEKVDIKRDVSRNPLFDVMFVLQDPDTVEPEIRGTGLAQYEYKTRTSKFDLTLAGVETGNHLLFTIEYRAKLFKAHTIERFAGYFQQLVFSVLRDPGKPIADLAILTVEEKRKILIEFNHSGQHPVNRTIPQLFAAQASRTPGHIAVAGVSRVTRDMHYISYNQLDSRTNRLAHLLQAKGVKPGTIVGMMMNRSIGMIVGILGILKADGAYLPINPKNPGTRTLYMLADSGVKILLSELIKAIDGIEVIDPGDLHIPSVPTLHMEEASLSKEGRKGGPRARGADLAYVIYTSGSTGNPKGVPVTYSNFSPLVHWGYRDLGIKSGDRVIQNLSYFFDWSVWEIFITLTTGAALFMITEEILLNPDIQVDFIDKYGITVLHITPTQYQYLVNVGKKPGTLKYLFIGAEKLNYDLVKRSIESVGPHCRIFNMYGPTEATIISAVMEIQSGTAGQYAELSSVPIGKPVGNTDLLVLDRYLNLSPPGVIGELYIAGHGVAPGYLNRPELTAEKFDHDLWDLDETTFNKKFLRGSRGRFLQKEPPGRRRQKIYKTGDLVRWLMDGTLEFLGRVDHQVKVRGFRIELGEIENRILNHEAIKDAIVIDKELKKGEKFICAYIVIKNSRAFDQGDTTVISAELKKYLSMGLPDYMIPSYFIPLDCLPLNPNGKVDRKALPEPALQPGESAAAPRGRIEKKLAEIWAEVLGKEVPDIDADFFQLGGHSLKAAIITAKIHKELHVNIPLVEIFKRPNIRGLSSYIASAGPGEYAPLKPTEKKEYYVLSSAQKRLYILQQMDLESTAYNMPLFLPLASEIRKEKLEGIFCHLNRRHESLRTSFRVVSGEPVQKVHKPLKVEAEYDERPGDMDCGMWEDKLTGLVKNFIKPFDLSRPPLWRMKLIRRDQERQLILMDMHHIVTDGISFDIIIKEFMTLNQGGVLLCRELQYKDYAEWQQGEGHQKTIKQQESYWLKVFSGKLPVLHLPLDFARPPKQSFAGKRFTFQISEDETNRLKDTAARGNATLFMVFLALLNVFFSRLTGQEDIIIGTPAGGRPHGDIENIVGMFVNTMAIRSYPRGHKRFMDFLGEVRARTLAAFENQSYQFDDLLDKLGVERAPNRNPLFDVMLVFNRQEEDARHTSKENMSHQGKGDDWRKFKVEAAKFDLLLSVNEENNLTVHFVYCSKLFNDWSIKKYSDYFRELISMVARDSYLEISSLHIIPAGEKKEIENKIRQGEMLEENRDGESMPVILPRTPVEKKLAAICQRLLKRDSIGINENFYRLGANSIKLLMLIAEVNNQFQRSLLVTDVIEHLTIEKLAALLTGDSPAPQPGKNIVLLNSKNQKNKDIFLVHDVSGNINGYILFSKSLEDKYNVYGLRMDPGQNLAPVNIRIEEIASRYIEEIKHTRDAGPYDLGGWSAGGIIAFEIARQMEMAGEAINSLIMFDAPAPVKKNKFHEFSLPGEIQLIKEYFQIPESWERASHLTGMEELWEELANYLTRHERYNAAYLKNIFPGYIELIPTIDRLSPGKILQQINIIRSVSRAIRGYYPGNKIKTDIRFFRPGGSGYEPTVWQAFCEGDIHVYPTGGKHATMLQEPHLSHLVKIFSETNG